jgi:hypothetical protein
MTEALIISIRRPAAAGAHHPIKLDRLQIPVEVTVWGMTSCLTTT